jgi:dUTP pyrophosphatase
MIKMRKVRLTAKLPVKERIGDAGFDVFYNGPNALLSPHSSLTLPLGFAIEIPDGTVALIQGRSGLAKDHTIFTIGNVIDSTYRGECHCTLCNMSGHCVIIEDGMKIAQMLIMPCYTGNTYEVVEELSPSDRGDKGFGSSGL